MKGYSYLEVFSGAELTLYQKAVELVADAPYKIDGVEVRCHELVRAVAAYLDLDPSQVQDGHFGVTDHSWIWTAVWKNEPFATTPGILDVYAVATYPPVRLVDSAHFGHQYRAGDKRKDIRGPVVRELVTRFEQKNAMLILG